MVDYSQPPVPPAQPIAEPPATEPIPAPAEPPAFPEETYSGGGITGSSKIEMAQLFVLGLVAASFIYSILYHRKQFNQMSKIEKLEKDVEELRKNLKNKA